MRLLQPMIIGPFLAMICVVGCMIQSAPSVTSPSMTVFSRHISVEGGHFRLAKLWGCVADIAEFISESAGDRL